MDVEAPAEAEGYDAVADVYDSLFTRPIDRAEDAVVREWIQEAHRPGRGPILDVGCGTGLLLDWFPDLPINAYAGLDVSRAMLAKANEKHPWRPFYRLDMDEADAVLPKRAFDLVVSLNGSMNYSKLRLEALLELYAGLLHPGGRFRAMLMSRRRYFDAGAWVSVPRPDGMQVWDLDEIHEAASQVFFQGSVWGFRYAEETIWEDHDERYLIGKLKEERTGPKHGREPHYWMIEGEVFDAR